MSAIHPWIAHYEESVPVEVEIPDMPLYQLVTDSAKNFPNNIAVRFVVKYLRMGLVIQSKLTYRELDDATNRFANALQALGVKKGDRVAIMLPNMPQQVIGFFGALKAGAVVVNTNPTYTPRELHHQLADSGAETIVMMSGLYEHLEKIRDKTDIKNVIIADVPDSLGWLFGKMVEKKVRARGSMADVPEAPDIHNFYKLINGQSARAVEVDISPDDVMLFQYTGGTTGVPKAAMLTHHNLVANAIQMDAWFTKVEYGKEKVLFALPAFHVYGMTVAMLLCMKSAGQLVQVPDPRETEHILNVVQNEGITIYPGVPSMYIAIINNANVHEYDLHSIKACLSGGSALPVDVAQKFEEITGGKLAEGYGLTETSPVANANPIWGEVRVGSIGLPISSTEAQIVSLEPDEEGHYAPLGVGEEGEICIRGPQVMKGYWGRPDETANVFDPDGWFHTGDIAKMDEDGYFYIVDRKKDLIIAGGYNIVPREVEEVLFMHPKVMEAAVVGIPDPKRGETVWAFIVPKEGQTVTDEELNAFCRENLAPYKVPRTYEFRDELPKTQVGKVLRRVLVEEEMAKQSGEEEVD